MTWVGCCRTRQNAGHQLQPGQGPEAGLFVPGAGLWLQHCQVTSFLCVGLVAVSQNQSSSRPVPVPPPVPVPVPVPVPENMTNLVII